jgi:hypothetical protein
VAVLLALASVTSTADAFAAAEIGGPPTNDFNRCYRDLRPCGDPLVIGTGHRFFGSVEIIAMQSRLGLCLEVDVVDEGGSSTCPGEVRPRDQKAVEMTMSSFASGRGESYTELIGPVVPEAAAVRVRYRRAGNPRAVDAILARVDGELQQRLEEPEPFAIFEAGVRGCLLDKRFRLAALDPAGAVIGRDRVRPGFGLGDEFCGENSGGTVTTVPGAVKRSWR